MTDDTQFIVRTEDAKGNYKYEAFTGTDKLAKMADGTIDVMFSEKAVSYTHLDRLRGPRDDPARCRLRQER